MGWRGVEQEEEEETIGRGEGWMAVTAATNRSISAFVGEGDPNEK